MEECRKAGNRGMDGGSCVIISAKEQQHFDALKIILCIKA